MPRPSAIVIGSGSWGVWTAIHLIQKGWHVKLIDKDSAGNTNSASGGVSRIIRLVYGQQSIYSDLTLKSYPYWLKLADRFDRGLYKETGVLWLSELKDNQYLQHSRKILSEMDSSLVTMELGDERVKNLNLEGIEEVYFEPGAGILKAEQCCQWASRFFEDLGGEVIKGKVEPVNMESTTIRVNDQDLHADKLIFATGSWTRSIFPELLESRTYVSRQEVFFYRPDDAMVLRGIPVWFNFDAEGMFYYGFPADSDGLIKVAYDDRSVAMHPDDPRDTYSLEVEERCRNFLNRRFPGINISSPVKFRICHYDNSADGDYILDRHPADPNLILMCGSSGHGFKTGPAVGELVANAVNDGTELPAEFSLGRFKSDTLKKTQFQ